MILQLASQVTDAALLINVVFCVGKFGRFRKTGKPAASPAIPLDGTSTTVVTQSTTTAVAPIATETTTAPSYAPNYGGVAGNEADGALGRGAWASKGGLVGGGGTTVV